LTLAPGSDGADGTSVVLQSVTDVEGGKQVTLAWGETPSTSSFVIPSGTPGTNGKDGKDGKGGKDGTSVHLDSVSTVAGGTQVTLGWGTSDTSAFVIPSGTPGTPGTNGKDGKDGTDGEDGVSPTISATELGPTEQHPRGGFAVTITDKTGSQTINIWNGNNGAGATVRLLEGTGIKIEADGSDYTIGVSADYALKSELPDVTDMATQTWVGQQGYLTSIPNTYALKSDVEAASANALSEAESWVVTEGYLKAVPDSYATKTYANDASANALSEAKTWVGQRGFITKDVDDLTYYYKTSETSSTSEITNALSTKLDSTVAAQTYQPKADMSNYLTTSDASTTYQPKGNYATTSNISDMATQTWVGQRGYLTQSDLASYATKTYADSTSAEALSQAKTWVNQQNFATSAGLAADTRYEMTNTGWTSAIKIQVDTEPPTANDGILHIILES
jgi:hypothetical protein